MRSVVVTNGNFFARIILDRLLRERREDVAGIVVITGIKPNKSRLQSLAEVWRQSGWRFFGYKASTYVVFALAAVLSRGRRFFVPALASELGIPLHFAAQVNSPQVLERVRKWEPDLLVSVSCPQIIGRELLAIPSKASINIHSSLLPSYAGLAPYLWVLSHGEVQTGTTVHLMDEHLDTGDILVQRRVAIEPDESVFSLFLKLSETGREALAEAVDRLTNGSANPVVQDASQRSYYSWPTRESVRALRERGHRLASVADFARALRLPILVPE